MEWSFKKYKRCMTDVSSVKEEEKDNVQLDATSGGSRKGSLTHVCGCSRSHNTDKNIFITCNQLKRLLYPLKFVGLVCTAEY